MRVVPRLAVGHIPNALGHLLLPVLPLCRFSRQSVRQPCRAAVALSPPKRRRLRPGPPGPAALRRWGGEGAGSGRFPPPPPPPCTDSSLSSRFRKVHIVFLTSHWAKDLLTLSMSAWPSAKEAASAFLAVKWGQVQPLSGAETRALLDNSGFLALPESCLFSLVPELSRDHFCPIYVHILSSWHGAWHTGGT